MPFTTTLLEGGRGVLQTAYGLVTAEEVLAGGISILEATRRGAAFTHGLIDFSEVTGIHGNAEDVQKIAALDEQIAKLVPRSCIAIVAPKYHIFGMGRMWQAYVERTGWTTQVFRHRAEAEAWLKEQRAHQT